MENKELDAGFIDGKVESGENVCVFLMSGVKLEGNIKEQDNYSLTLTSFGEVTQLVYKHGIASVMPSPKANPNESYNDDNTWTRKTRGYNNGYNGNR